MKTEYIPKNFIRYPYPAVTLKNVGNFWYGSLYRNGSLVSTSKKLLAWSSVKKLIKIREKLNSRK